MSSPSSLAFVATWFVLGMARIVATSTLAEHRIDNPDPRQALAMNRAARTERLRLANYDPGGRRLLPWYRLINGAYWTVVACVCLWAICHV